MRISDWSSDVCSSDLVGQADRAPAADRDAGLTQVIGARGVAEHAHRLFGPGDLGPPARGVEVHLSQFLVHLARGQAIALHPRRIEDDANLDRKSTRLNSSH